jgi:hypothetical protein
MPASNDPILQMIPCKCDNLPGKLLFFFYKKMDPKKKKKKKKKGWIAAFFATINTYKKLTKVNDIGA